MHHNRDVGLEVALEGDGEIFRVGFKLQIVFGEYYTFHQIIQMASVLQY